MKLKKLLSVVISLALLLSLISVPVFADGNNVAQIGDTEYATLADAIAAVPTNGTQTTIKMLADETIENIGNVGLTVAANKNIVLDLNGKTVSGISNLISTRFIDNKGTLEITDSSANEDGKITFRAVADTGYSVENITIYNIGGKLTLTKGTIENTTNGGLTYAVNTSSNAWGTGDDKYSEFTMTGGRLAGANTDNTLRVYQNCAVGNVASHNTVSISGGVIDNGIFVDTYLYIGSANTANYVGSNIDTRIDISGGTVNGLIDLKIRHPFNTVLNITGGDFTNAKLQVRKHGEYNTNFSEPTEPMVNISGGCFAFANAGKAFLMAYDSTDSSWSTYEKAYEITGGKYSVDPSAYVAEGYQVVENTDADADIYPYVIGEAVTYVAQIGDNKYDTLADAIAAVPTGGTQTTITMIANESVAAGVTIAVGKNIVLDLNGKTISGNTDSTTSYALITNRGTLTIQDSTDVNANGGGTGKITTLITTPDQGDMPGYASNTITNNGVLTIESGLVESQTTGGWATYTVDNQTNGGSYTPVFTMNGGRLYNAYTDAVRMFLNSDSRLNKVVINGGILDTDKQSGRIIVFQDANAKLNKGELDITGGTINGTISAWSGGTSTYEFTDAQYDEIAINISGGKIYELDFSEYMTNEALRAAALQVTGGKYSVDPSAYVTEGYSVVDNTDDDAATYPYVIGEAVTYVAQVGATRYTSLEEALAAAPAGATVDLLADIDYSTVYTERNARDYGREHAIDLKDCTLDMNGYTISTINATVVFGGNGATIENGTFNLVPKNTDGSYKDGSYALIIDNAALGYNADDAVTVNDVVCNGGVNVCATTVELNNVTASTTPTKFYTVWAEQNANVTVNSGVYVDTVDKGKGIFATGTGDEGGAVITVNGGTFTGVNNLKYSGEAGSVVIYGGTYNKVPTAFVASGYEAVDNRNGTWTVGKVKAGNLTEAEQANDGYDATYTVKKQVVDANDTTIAQGTERTVNVKVVDTIDSEADKAVASSEDTTPAEIIENLDMDKVLANVVASVADSDKTIDVDVQVVRDKPALDVSTNTITYEVHPEVIVTVNGVAADPVVVSNDALDENASFTITLPVPAELKALAVNGKIRVIHRSEGSEPEVLFHEVLGDAGNYYIQFNVSHFSEFELGSPLFTGHSISLNGYIDLNFYLNVTADQVTTGTGTVVDFTWARGSTSYQIKTIDFVEGKGYKATVKLPASEMNYQINAAVKIDGALQTETNSYSVREYCDEILDSDSAFSVAYVDAYGTDKYNSLVYLVKTMLDYGAKAQDAFGRTDVAYANAGIDYTMQSVTGDMINSAIYAANGRYADDMSVISGNIGAYAYTPSLIFLSGCTLRQYFIGQGLNGNFDGTKSAGEYTAYYVEKTNIAAAELDTLQEFDVGGVTFSYSALDYVRAIICNYNGSDPGYKLAAATYWYNQAANAYFANN